MVDTIDSGTTTKRTNGDRNRRKGGTEQYPAWMVSWKAAEYSDMAESKWKHYSAAGLLPPSVGTRRSGYSYRRTDLDAWKELQRLKLWEDWKPLVREHGKPLAWEIMLVRLERTKTALRARAEELA